MIQVIPFVPSKGGTTPNLCLANVVKGYGISNKYPTAWEAWQHTQQHPDRNIPAGLSVPLFYSYTTTIDGVTQNYGHINVQLPNGTFWSDGNIYASLDAYLANHSPKYVGWGESVNDFKILEGANMVTISQEEYDDLKKWKAIGVDALPYKDSVVSSKAWKTDMKQSVNNVLPVINDLWQYKQDGNDSQYVLVTEPTFRRKA